MARRRIETQMIPWLRFAVLSLALFAQGSACPAATAQANEWTWFGGSSTLGSSGIVDGVYGTLGTPAPGNTPGSRARAATWSDKSGNLWLFSGGVFQEYYNDLWMFNPSSAQWAWMGGSNANLPGVYGTLGTPSAGNTAGGRLGAVTWSDESGHFWMFGGFGLDSANPTTVNTVVAGGFSGAVLLSAVGLPSGITASFNPSSITGFGASQVTFSVALGVTPGNYTLNVNGTSAGVSETTTVSLMVFSAPPTFMFGATATSLAVKSGASGTVTLTVTPEYGFNSAVSFACSGLPAGATCTFSPATVTPSGTPATSVLTISTSSRSASRSDSRPFLPLTALAAGLCVFIQKKRRGLRYMVVVAALAGLGLTFGCGGGSGNGGGSVSTPVTSTVTITAKSATVMQTTALTLTVN